MTSLAVTYPTPSTPTTSRVRSCEARAAPKPEVVTELFPGYWRGLFRREHCGAIDIMRSLVDTFVGRVVLEDPTSTRALKGRSVIFVGNHQTAIESMPFLALASELLEQPVVAMAKKEHRKSSVGRFAERLFAYPGVKDPQLLRFIDRKDPFSLITTLRGLSSDLKNDRASLLIHADGTRALSARQGLGKISGKIIDLALKTDTPIVPVRFCGGLPVAPLDARTDLPHGASQQDLFIGAPIMPEELRAMGYQERKRLVKNRVNELGVSPEAEQPSAPRPELDARLRHRQTSWGVDPIRAAVAESLRELGGEVSPATRRLRAELGLGDAVRDAAEPAVDGGEAKWVQRFAEYLRQVHA